MEALLQKEIKKREILGEHKDFSFLSFFFATFSNFLFYLSFFKVSVDVNG